VTGDIVNAVTNTLSPIWKALFIAAFLAVVLVLEANGVAVPVDVDSLWDALLVLVLPTGVVFFAPRNKPKYGTGT
jgi:hypothetical protein